MDDDRNFITKEEQDDIWESAQEIKREEEAERKNELAESVKTSPAQAESLVKPKKKTTMQKLARMSVKLESMFSAPQANASSANLKALHSAGMALFKDNLETNPNKVTTKELQQTKQKQKASKQNKPDKTIKNIKKSVKKTNNYLNDLVVSKKQKELRGVF
jgi:hypothetical protein